MIKKTFFAICFGTIVGLLGGLIAFRAPPSSLWEKTITERPVTIGGPFSLVDVSGKERTEKDFLGRPLLVFFGFTHCPDVCPAGLQTLTIALNNMDKISDTISTVFITIDPDRDTPQILGNYLQSFHSKIQGLSGSSEQIQKIIKAYRVYTKKIQDQSDPRVYSFDHSSFFYLMDEKGKYVKHFPSSIMAEKLSSELTSYLKKLTKLMSEDLSIFTFLPSLSGVEEK